MRIDSDYNFEEDESQPSNYEDHDLPDSMDFRGTPDKEMSDLSVSFAEETDTFYNSPDGVSHLKVASLLQFSPTY